MDEDRRRFERYKCEIEAGFEFFTPKKEGKTYIKNAGMGGINFSMRNIPELESVLLLRVDKKRLSRYVDYNRIIVNSDNIPLVRVVHVTKDKKQKRVFNIGARFMVEPGMRTGFE